MLQQKDIFWCAGAVSPSTLRLNSLKAAVLTQNLRTRTLSTMLVRLFSEDSLTSCMHVALSSSCMPLPFHPCINTTELLLKHSSTVIVTHVQFCLQAEAILEMVVRV